jgi:ABC-type transport system involved in multi-copper enzyme maturation permease subunit
LLLKPTPLAIFVRGMDESLCQQHIIRIRDISASQSEQAYNMLFKLFATPDLFYIVKVILALFAILLSFNLVSEEKEARTLALACSNSISRPNLLLGKWISGLMGLVAPLLVAILISAIVINLSPQIQMDWEHWLKLILLIVSSMLYLAFFFSLGLLVSCVYTRSSSALVVSLFLWIFFVFIIPGLGRITAETLVDIPPAQSIMIREHMAEVKRVQQEIEESGGYRYIMDYPEIDKLLADYRGKLERQLEFSKSITRISPAAVYTLLATDFAGTGIMERLELKRSVLIHRNTLIQSLKNSSKALPVITYKRLAAADILAREGLINLMVILLQNVVIFSAAYVLFLRYDVR